MTYSIHLTRHLRFVIGENIHHYRARQKMTLRKLFCLTGIPEWLLDHYELGKNDMGLLELHRIACALNVDIRELLGSR